MSFSLNLIARLKKDGYREVSLDTAPGAAYAHVVYLIASDDAEDVKFYSLSTRAPKSCIGRFQKFLKQGSAKHLPVPVKDAVDFSFAQHPEYHVKAYYKPTQFSNDSLVTKLRKDGAKELGAKERTAGPYVNVYKLGITGDDRFKIVVSKLPKETVVSQFISKSKDQISATYETKAGWYRNWCQSNERRLHTKNATVEVLATGLIPGAGKMWAKLYLDAANPALILNSKW